MWENYTFYFLCKGARLSQNNIKSYYNREWRTDWVSEWLSERQTISKRSFATKNIKLTFKICWPTKARYYTYVLLYTRLIISFWICNRNRTFWRFIMRRKKMCFYSSLFPYGPVSVATVLISYKNPDWHVNYTSVSVNVRQRWQTDTQHQTVCDL